MILIINIIIIPNRYFNVKPIKKILIQWVYK